MNARYTVQVRDLMNNPESMAALQEALSKYPLYQPDKNYDLIPSREELNRRILNHYKWYEIGFEVPGRYYDELAIAMDEIMPKANARFKTIATMEEIDNPFDTVDFKETFEETRESSASSSGASESSNSSSVKDESSSTDKNTTSEQTSDTGHSQTYGKDIESDTPQSNLAITGQEIDSVNYASKVNWSKNNGENSNEGQRSGSSESESSGTNTRTGSDTSEGSSSSESQSSETIRHTFEKKGAMGVTTFGHDMIEFRQSIIDVMDEIINDERLACLHMRVF